MGGEVDGCSAKDQDPCLFLVSFEVVSESESESKNVSERLFHTEGKIGLIRLHVCPLGFCISTCWLCRGPVLYGSTHRRLDRSKGVKATGLLRLLLDPVELDGDLSRFLGIVDDESAIALLAVRNQVAKSLKQPRRDLFALLIDALLDRFANCLLDAALNLGTDFVPLGWDGVCEDLTALNAELGIDKDR